VARAISPDGTLEIFDVQQEMLDHTMQAAENAGLVNVVPRRGDARELPYENESFDGVFLVTVLGEITDRAAALRAIHRVLKPSGRLVVGELFGDPHMMTLSALRSEASEAGLSFDDRRGPVFGYFARFRRLN
jgi:ubiquinone/menaquinone biosynthesis C-methylase UbiE